LKNNIPQIKYLYDIKLNMPIKLPNLGDKRFVSRAAAFEYFQTPAGRREQADFSRGESSRPRPTRPPSPPSPKVEPNSSEAFGKMYPIPETRQDAFRVLKLNQNANQSDIKTAYRELSRLVHPDKNPPDEQTRLKCTAKQQQVYGAYLLLKPKTGGKKRRTAQRKSMKKSKSKRLNKHFKKSRRHTQT
jgi:hypothetical protein